MRVSYHNHSRWSDGRDSLTDMLAAAPASGLTEVGISDHFTLFPDERTVSWRMPPTGLADYVRAVQTAAVSSGITVRLGLEADFLPETVEVVRQQVAQHPFDFVLGSVHFVDRFAVDNGDGSQWIPLSVDERNDVWRRYWGRVADMAASGAFDIVSHLDLPKKFGYRPTVDLSREAFAALDAIRSADMAIEINTKGWAVPAQEAYPTLDLLRGACERGIPLLISADAHRTTELTRRFDDARVLARAAGYTHSIGFQGRSRFNILLED